jgi:hypothetical protein
MCLERVLHLLTWPVLAPAVLVARHAGIARRRPRLDFLLLLGLVLRSRTSNTITNPITNLRITLLESVTRSIVTQRRVLEHTRPAQSDRGQLLFRRV